MPGPGAPKARRAATVLAVAGAVVLGVTAIVTGPGAASASLSSPATGSARVVRYAVNKPVCSQPSDPKALRCYGLKQVLVPKGTPGAYRVLTSIAGTITGQATAAAFPGYRPAQLAAAYGVNANASRSNITVGIVLWHDAPTVLSDLQKFDRANGIHADGKQTESKRSFRKVNERGQTTRLPKRDRGAASEIALDTQAVRGMCHKCRIVLVEADGPYDKNLANAVNTAVRLGATIVTNSYGGPEFSGISAKFRSAFNHPGVAFVASTGDSGWYGWDDANDPRYTSENAPSFPATSPSVIAVGGTSLVLSHNRRSSEAVWNNNGNHDETGSARAKPMGASGGGCSRLFAAPAWQRRTPGYAAAGCHGRRLATDVALVADPRTGYQVYDTYGSGGKVVIGGTSLSAPLAAGILGASGGPRGARYPATSLYARGSHFDIRTGGNAYCGSDSPSQCSTATFLTRLTNNPNKLGGGLVDCTFPRSDSEQVPSKSNPECTASRGFDGPSGVGSPTSAGLFTRSDPYTSVRYSGTPKQKHTTKFRAGVSTPVRGTAITYLSWNWGDHRKSTVSKKTRVASHSYRKKGRYTITLTTHDSRGGVEVTKRKITVR